jgi:hypothetical protein
MDCSKKLVITNFSVKMKNYSYHMVSESVVRDKYLKNSMFEIN